LRDYFDGWRLRLICGGLGKLFLGNVKVKIKAFCQVAAGRILGIQYFNETLNDFLSICNFFCTVVCTKIIKNCQIKKSNSDLDIFFFKNNFPEFQLTKQIQSLSLNSRNMGNKSLCFILHILRSVYK
jgi:hypothetical protein